MVSSSKKALVTGAGRGIGRAIALALADAGFAVIVNDLDGPDQLAQRTVDEIIARGGAAQALTFDISDIDGLAAIADRAWSLFGGLDCLVNNAGVSVKQRGDLLDVTPESYDRLMAINLRGPFFLTQQIARRMLAESDNAFRSVITISSANAEFASVDRAEYCLSKTGLSMMTQLFAVRLAEAGIATYEVRPGIIRSDMTAVATAKYDRLIGEGMLPIARWGEPEDIGRAVAMLAGGSLAYSTGEVIRVDGGLAVRRF